jgi:hypothetical protein
MGVGQKISNEDWVAILRGRRIATRNTFFILTQWYVKGLDVASSTNRIYNPQNDWRFPKTKQCKS